jgi:small-conductance mechanosensitive channel
VFEQIILFFESPLKLWGITLSPLDIVLLLLLPLIGGFIIYKLLVLITKKVIIKPFKEETGKTVLKTVKLVLRLIFILYVFMLVVNILGPNIIQFIEGIGKMLSNPFFKTDSGSTSISVITVIMIIPIFYLGTWLSRITKRFIDKSMLTRVTMASETKFTISILVRNAVMIFTILIGLSMIGIDLSAIGIIFGVLGIGLGFGLQNVVANFFAGLVLIFERPIKEGDRIVVNSIEGEVIQIKFRSTVINTLTNETIIVPNSKLVDDTINNYSFNNPRIIVVNRVSVSYESELNKVKNVLEDLCEDNPFILKTYSPVVRIMEYRDSGILMELRVWIKNARDKYDALAWTNKKIWEEFKKHNIVIPFNQLDVHIKNGYKNNGIEKQYHKDN